MNVEIPNFLSMHTPVLTNSTIHYISITTITKIYFGTVIIWQITFIQIKSINGGFPKKHDKIWRHWKTSVDALNGKNQPGLISLTWRLLTVYFSLLRRCHTLSSFIRPMPWWGRRAAVHQKAARLRPLSPVSVATGRGTSPRLARTTARHKTRVRLRCRPTDTHLLLHCVTDPQF